MFKLIKFLIALVVVAGLVYFAYFVKLGEMTLWEHLVGISETEEAQGLKQELGEKASEIKEDVAKKVPAFDRDDTSDEKDPKADAKGSPDKAGGKDASPLSELTDEDREALIELLKKKNK